jgi:hypothetical protein
MRPEDARFGVLRQHALDSLAVAVQVQPEAICCRASCTMRRITGRSASAPKTWNSPIAA